MNRRDCFALPLILAGCGGAGGEMAEYQLQPSPAKRTSKEVFASGTIFNWTPAITFGTPGDLSVAYQIQSGKGIIDGDLVFAQFHIQTSSFTHTTASGRLWITGFQKKALILINNFAPTGGLNFWQGITKANYTQLCVEMFKDGSLPIAYVNASGSGRAATSVNAADVPTGGTVLLVGSITYFLDRT